MFKKLSLSIFTTIIFVPAFSAFSLIFAQKPPPPPPPPLPAVRGQGSGYDVGMASGTKDDDKGSIVRGRVFYRDSGFPVRRGWIGFRKIKELIEPPQSADESPKIVVPYSYGNEKYVLTNDQGEFEMKGVKSGIYQPFLKVQGILNPDFTDRENPQFQQIAVDGVSETQTSIGVQRGAAIGGKILYSDGSPVIGAKVQVFKNEERISENYSYGGDDITTEKTDDRGVYRFSGLPAGEYILRVTEPTLHGSSGKATNGYEMDNIGRSSELKTYYPNTENSKDAGLIQAFLGQEQTNINITIPDRRLFTISGLVVAKNNKAPLAGINITFNKIDERISGYNSGQSKQVKTDAAGTWNFKDLPKGKYIIKAEQNLEYDYSNGKQTLKTTGAKFASVFEEVELDEKNLDSLVIELPFESTISGFVSVEGGKPLPDYVSVRTFDETLKNEKSTTVRLTGKETPAEKLRKPFTIDGVSEGKFYFAGFVEQSYYVKSIRYGSSDLLVSPLEIKENENIENIEVVLSSDVGILKGKVNNIKNGELAFVVLIPTGKKGLTALASSQQVFVSPDGSFAGKAAPGDYYIFVGTQKNRPNFNKFEDWLNDIRANAQTITIRANETNTVDLNYPTN